MTIGTAFLCEDGIVMCSDTQITFPANHKYYEKKVYLDSEPGIYTAAFTFAGNPNLMKSFFGKFTASMKLVAPPLTESRIHEVIETVLGLMDVLDTDPDGLHMLSGIVVPTSGMKLLRTERKIVGEIASRFDYVGVGDSSLLRYLARLMTEAPVYTAEQAYYVGSYLIQQAKRYIDGCGGETNGVVLKKNGSATHFTDAYLIEQSFLRMEFLLGRVATYFFDDRISEPEFNDHLERFTNALKRQRPDFHRHIFGS